MKKSLIKNTIALLTVGLFLSSCGSRNNTKFYLSSYQETLYCGQTYTITPVFEGNISYTFDDFSFVSNDEAIATVSKTGLIETYEKAGSTSITCTYLPSNYSLSFSLIVKDFTKTSEIICSRDSFNLPIGGSMDFEAISYSENATFSSLLYEIENPEIASITDFKITGLKSGETNLVIKADEPGNAYSIKVPIYVSEDDLSKPLDDSFRRYGDEAFSMYDMTMSSGIEATVETKTLGDKTKLLVLPIEFPDYPFESSALDDLDLALNGTKEEIGYWESVSSYFYKSSFGKLDMEFVMLDTYKTSDISYKELKNYNDSARLVIEGVNNHQNNHPDFKFSDYDQNKDTAIDGVIAIYSAPDNYNTTDPNIYGKEQFWAYTTSTGRFGTLDNPVVNKYFFSSIDFQTYTGASKADAHTYIHEMGHMLGLPDYYDYSFKSSPTGMYDMQDNNVGDHNAWSKFAFGWTNPYIYETNKHNGARIHLDNYQKSGSSLVILDDYYGTAYDEMLVLELYTPTGLNEVDASDSNRYYLKMPNAVGVKILHVDARLSTKPYNGKDPQNYIDYTKIKDEGLPTGSYPMASNTKSYSYTKEGFAFLTMISKKEEGGTFLKNYRSGWGEDDLFKTGDTFSFKNQAKSFHYGDGLMNDKTDLNIEIYFENVDENGVDLIINRVK